MSQPSPKPAVVITGAGRGIGRAAALAFAKLGHPIALLARTEAEIVRVADEVRALGAQALPLPCDVSVSRAVEAATQRVLEDLGVPQVLVNNAGIVRRSRVVEHSEADWDAVIDVNLKGPFLMTRAFLPSMLAAKRGRIINVASISATLGTPGLSAYCAAKWGVVGFTKALCEELRSTGLQTLSILPGSVDTDMLKGSGFAAQMSAEDVANTIVYAALQSPDAMNGSSVEVFGP